MDLGLLALALGHILGPQVSECDVGPQRAKKLPPLAAAAARPLNSMAARVKFHDTVSKWSGRRRTIASGGK